jgi:hypothetical protein
MGSIGLRDWWSQIILLKLSNEIGTYTHDKNKIIRKGNK